MAGTLTRQANRHSQARAGDRPEGAAKKGDRPRKISPAGAADTGTTGRFWMSHPRTRARSSLPEGFDLRAADPEGPATDAYRHQGEDRRTAFAAPDSRKKNV